MPLTDIRGLELATTGKYELVVLDLLLPSLDGETLLQELMEARPSQRVLVLSALSDVETKVRCLEFGASDYVSKPFSLAELDVAGSGRGFDSLHPDRSNGCSMCVASRSISRGGWQTQAPDP